ncbi:AlbA family DNA-binding domain-containing protein [Streptomyces viridochromogenes]|uniref:Putative AAA-4 family protein n=1 Tax=Streptomyces viridochromogenes Tue57 TaxID=1160705 RepID=L8PR84_STRVR|nr:ATP-binding protein [Streptomyces viridochromogenes]ELS59010.1 putative AAA-4 family protein [Streptomyces viridochromogenes Tue57]
MARSWTRLHEHLGHPPGPLTYDMVAAAVADKLPESDDLDWKEPLPGFARTPGVWNEFAKDVAAMANTRGGLLIYGVSDDIKFVGVDLAKVDEKQMLSAIRNGIQPYISGIDIIPLPAPGGAGPDVLVVDVPPSEMAPHFQYGWEAKDKDRATFNAPHRINDHTFYMHEHQVARAYRERFARQDGADALLQAGLTQTTETVLSESEGLPAWLVIAARLTRPVPRMVPAPTHTEAKYTLHEALKTAGRINDVGGPAVLSNVLGSDLQVGLRRWVASSFLVPDRRSPGRDAMVELHHDGTVTVSAELAHGLPPHDGVPVNLQVLQTVVLEAVSLADGFRRRLAADSSLDITATIATANTGNRLLPFSNGFGGYAPMPETRRPHRLLPASTELAPNANNQTLRDGAHELTDGLLHQFGINLQR